MKFNQHYALEGTHAFLSASKYHWINDDDDRLKARYSNWRATQRGVELHDFAARAIKNRIKVARLKGAIYQYINDAIGFNMEPEQVLYYSPHCYGTVDAIGFKDNFLRIHDYKSGVTKASFKQLHVYTALFCLEYKIDPASIEIELRIYQGFEYSVDKPDPEYIQVIMDKIVIFDSMITKWETEI